MSGSFEGIEVSDHLRCFVVCVDIFFGVGRHLRGDNAAGFNLLAFRKYILFVDKSNCLYWIRMQECVFRMFF